MNPINETNQTSTEQNVNEGEALPTSETSADNTAGEQPTINAAEAATDISDRLSDYEKWQAKHSGLLFDGTYSLASYIRIASGDGIEYGIQPRIGRGHGKRLALALRVRVAHVVEPLRDGAEQPAAAPVDGDAAEAKAEKLYAFVGGDKGPWQNESPDRISFERVYPLPVEVHTAEALPQFLALLDAGLLDSILNTLPTPAAGWDTSALRTAKLAWTEYLQLSANQFGIFKEVITIEHVWDELAVAGELTPELVEFVNAIGGEQGGSPDETSGD